MATWRVMLSSKLWKQKKYEEDWTKQPEVHLLAQSKGRCKMVVCPKKGDTVKFVFNKRVVMEGKMESDGFLEGKEHQEHSCNEGDQRPHADLEEFAWVRIEKVGLSEEIVWKGQRTWVKL